MENTPSKIAGDIVIAALAASGFYKKDSAATANEIAAAFTKIHASVFEAAKQDAEAGLSSPLI